MKYRLKDRELQEKLDAISGGDFSKRLQDPAKSEEGFAVAYGDFPEINGLRHLSLFLADEIEEVPEYDPKAWNEWPDVEPPEHVLMQVEFKEKDKERLYRSCWKWSGYEWNWGDGRGFVSVNTDNLREIRFRPWGDS